MFSLWIAAGDERDELLAEVWEAGTIGVTEEEEGIRAFFEDSADVLALTRFRPVRVEDDGRDWAAVVREQWRAFPVGSHWWLAPEWDTSPVPDGRTLLRIYPGLACGTGWHAATQLCLTAMEQHIPAGTSVLDVGTGSGILAHAAVSLGATSVYGCDIEHDSTLVAQANSPSVVALFTGSLRSVRTAGLDAVVANLNAATLSRLAGDMARVLKPGGIAIVSGFEEDEVPDVAASVGHTEIAALEQEGWACLVFRYPWVAE